jgi:CBS domain-containing protein
MAITKVRDVMTKHVVSLQVETTLDKAAAIMRDQGIGDVVVADGDRVVGLVTDRDVVVRAVADGREPASTTLGSIVSRDLVAVRPDDTAQEAALLMRDRAVRRVLVLDDERGLVGILSIGDLAVEIDPESVLGGISEAAPNT